MAYRDLAKLPAAATTVGNLCKRNPIELHPWIARAFRSEFVYAYVLLDQSSYAIARDHMRRLARSLSLVSKHITVTSLPVPLASLRRTTVKTDNEENYNEE